MAIEVEVLTDLDADNVVQEQEALAQLMGELDDNIDTRRGVLHDLLFYLEAIYGEKNNEEITRLQRSQSLLEASADPELAEDDIIDAIASNFRVTRREGSAATGELTIIISALSPLTIAAGTVWEASGLEFTNSQAFSAVVSSSNVTSSTDRVLNPVGDGTYSFTIEVTASENGVASRVAKDTLFIPQVPPINFVKAYATADFTGGTDEESNANLIGRLLVGTACKALSGSTTMVAALTAQSDFENIVGSSIIGFGDAEMLRDQHSIFPGSLGGRVDWYVRTQEKPQLVGLTKTATLMQKTDDARGIWQFGIGRDDLPGFYDVESVVPEGEADATTFAITSDVRSSDLTELDNDGFLPDIEESVESVYSRFQAAVIQFKDTETVTTSLTEGSSTQDYSVTLRGMPLIDDIQDWASSRSVRNKAGDALIKAPVPCFLRISFTVQLKPGQESPDTDTIANNVAALVNQYGFTGRLPASAIADTVHNSLTGVAHVGAIDILGDIRRPDGVIRRIRASDVLVVPYEPGNMVTSRTVAFIVDPSDIAVSVETADIPEV